jgi:HEPN domain-containing protein
MNARERRRREEAERWLGQAAEDLAAAEWLVEGGHFNLACFHAQQAAEKALKGFLYSAGHRALGHGVSDLCALCAQFDPAFAELRDDIAVLDAYYVPTRYPNALPGGIPASTYDHTAAEGAIQLARRALDFSRDRAGGRAAGPPPRNAS